jgi:hypothetical protein
MKSSLWDQFSDEKGVVDFGRCGGRSGPREEARRFLAALVQVWGAPNGDGAEAAHMISQEWLVVLTAQPTSWQVSETKEKPMFSLGELCAVADQVGLILQAAYEVVLIPSSCVCKH